jgi:hypothetical protein
VRAYQRWDRRDLLDRLGRALAIANRTLSLLGSDGYHCDDGVHIASEKIVAETALLLVMAAPAASGDARTAAVHRQVATRLAPLARGQSVRAGICLAPPLAREHAFAHACLSHLGYLDADLDSLLVQSLAATTASSVERLPHRQLEQDWLGRLWRPVGGSLLEDPSDVARRSALGAPLDVLAGSRGDLYGFTHSLLFATDLGARRITVRRPDDELCAEAEGVLGWCLDEQDYDLAAEILLTWPLLRHEWSPAATFGFTVLTAVEDAAGFLPSPTIDSRRYHALAAAERPRYAVAAAYHTAYAMGLLCGAILKQQWCPPRGVPAADGSSRGAAAALLEILDTPGRESHWRHHLAGLDLPQRDALGTLLLAIGLRRTAVEPNLPKMQSMLQVGQHFGLNETPAALQALELLGRALSLQGAGGASDA